MKIILIVRIWIIYFPFLRTCVWSRYQFSKCQKSETVVTTTVKNVDKKAEENESFPLAVFRLCPRESQIVLKFQYNIEGTYDLIFYLLCCTIMAVIF